MVKHIHLKNLSKYLLIFLFFINLLYADDTLFNTNQNTKDILNGFYIGAGVGPGINFVNPTNTKVTFQAGNIASFGFRLFTGYNISKNLSFELGYTNFGDYENYASGTPFCDFNGVCTYSAGYIDKDFSHWTTDPTKNTSVLQTQVNAVNNINSYAIDLTAIGKYNITDNMNLFGRAGVNYLNAFLDTNSITNPEIISPYVPYPVGLVVMRNTQARSSAILPILGAGYEYKPSPHVGLRIEYDYYFSVNMVDDMGINEGAYTPSIIMFSTAYYF